MQPARRTCRLAALLLSLLRRSHCYDGCRDAIAAIPHRLWSPEADGPALSVKVLSYNLFWWNLFGQRGGNGDSAGKLIAAAMKPEPFDFMGFQECEDAKRVLGPVGLLDHFTVLQGPHAICAAYRTGAWELLDSGNGEVAEDMRTNFYGRRGAMWLRLRNTDTGRTVVFVNHHGPLSVNSGGTCGGLQTATNLLGLMAAHGQDGDSLLLVGDFNANAASLTIQGLWHRLTHVHNGVSFGGVDNIFSNVGRSHVVRTENLGSGGSDHDAISAVIQLGGPPLVGNLLMKVEPIFAINTLSGLGSPKDDWNHFWCGMMENDISYHVEASSWSRHLDHQLGGVDVASPQRCCRLCQREAKCASWQWAAAGAYGRPSCSLQGGAVVAKLPAAGIVSGLAATEAAKAALQAAGDL